MQPDAASIEELHCIPFLDDDLVIQALQQELLNYLDIPEDTADEFDTLQRWERHSEELPRCSMQCKKIFLLQRSSTASERVFPFAELFYASKRKSTRRLH